MSVSFAIRFIIIGRPRKLLKEMSEKKFVIGIEFGLRTDRAVLVNVRDRSEIIAVVSDFPNGAIDHTLPDSGKQIPTE